MEPETLVYYSSGEESPARFIKCSKCGKRERYTNSETPWIAKGWCYECYINQLLIDESWKDVCRIAGEMFPLGIGATRKKPDRRSERSALAELVEDSEQICDYYYVENIISKLEEEK